MASNPTGPAVAAVSTGSPIAADGSATRAIHALDAVGARSTVRTRAPGTAGTAQGQVVRERILIEIDHVTRGDEDAASQAVAAVAAALTRDRGRSTGRTVASPRPPIAMLPEKSV